MNTITRRALNRLTLALAGMVLAACLSPTLPPLPPPDAPANMKFVGEGDLLLQGAVPAEDARVMVVNHQTDRIFGQVTADGRYSLHVQAQPGDYLELWYSQGNYSSNVRGFEAPRAAAVKPDAGADAGADAAP